MGGGLQTMQFERRSPREYWATGPEEGNWHNLCKQIFTVYIYTIKNSWVLIASMYESQIVRVILFEHLTIDFGQCQEFWQQHYGIFPSATTPITYNYFSVTKIQTLSSRLEIENSIVSTTWTTHSHPSPKFFTTLPTCLERKSRADERSAVYIHWLQRPSRWATLLGSGIIDSNHGHEDTQLK